MKIKLLMLVLDVKSRLGCEMMTIKSMLCHTSSVAHRLLNA